MPCPVVEDEHIEGLGNRLRKVIQPDLEGAGIEPREFKKEAVARGRFNGPLEIEIVKLGGHGGNRLHPAGRNAPPDDGQQAPAAFILGQHFERGAGRAMVALLLEDCGKGCLKLAQGFRTCFAWDGRGRVGFARRVPRTRA